jgi:ring-1,2-phenylacetyl-CoA epoxidase subunit PaaD
MIAIDQSKIIERIKNIPDPEIPVISISDLGILRGIVFQDARVEVTITPTYSGCPAMKAIENEIREVLKEAGLEQVEFKMVYAPAWTTDWLSDAAKEKLRVYGIAPPGKRVAISGKQSAVICPRCGSDQTTMVSFFGSTACKSLYKCNACLEPFDYFKCH